MLKNAQDNVTVLPIRLQKKNALNLSRGNSLLNSGLTSSKKVQILICGNIYYQFLYLGIKVFQKWNYIVNPPLSKIFIIGEPEQHEAKKGSQNVNYYWPYYKFSRPLNMPVYFQSYVQQKDDGSYLYKMRHLYLI